MVAMCCLPLAAGRCCPGKRKSPQPASTSQYRCFQGKNNIQPSGRLSRLTNSPRPPASIKESLIAQGLRPSEVARIIHVHRSTIYRELRRNRLEKQYDPARAHALTQQQRRFSAKYRVPQDTIDFVDLTLSLEWSPEQISGRMK